MTETFHATATTGSAIWNAVATRHEETHFRYAFENFFHPFVGELIDRLNRTSVAGMLDPAWQKKELTREVFSKYFKKLETSAVKVTSYREELDLSQGGPYANYNWELLFHVPLTIASHLSANQRFAEAQRWFHLIFDPTCNDTSIPAPQRFWKFAPFRDAGPTRDIGELLALLSKPDAECTIAEREAKKQIINGYDEIRTRPFQPHAVARTRTLAYQYAVVMKYVTNLIRWGDTLFMQDTIESINEATQRYVLAANILGPKPEQLPPRGTIRPKSFAQLRAAGLDAMGNALVELEGQFPFNFPLLTQPAGGSVPQSGPPFGLGSTLYFCVPRNDKLLALWDETSDRLLKVRNCMNIQGVVRQLDLFTPRLDPGMLVKAAAAGIDVGSIVNGLNQPIGPVRALPMIRQALELCAEVRGFGNALLAAMEKCDGEELTLLRHRHETAIQKMTQDVRFLQLKQAEEATESLLRSRRTSLERYRFYLRALDLQPDATLAPETLTPDRRELTEENFDEAFAALVGQYDKTIPTQDYPRTVKAGTSAPAAQSGAASTGQLHLTTAEDAQLNQHMREARDVRAGAAVAETVATVLTFIPEFNIELEWWGLGGSSNIFGGAKLSDALKIGAEIARTYASWESDQAEMTGRTAGHERRLEEWSLQGNLAALELTQVGRQIVSSLIAEQIARHEYEILKKQVEQTGEVERFLLEDKHAGRELYAWMLGEVSRLYYEYYRFAVDTARRAERTMKRELMRPELDATDYIRFNYWDGGRKGLLAAEALHLDLKRMEMAYHDNNRREYELTRHISLRQLDPLALLRLKMTGRCEVTIPEWLYDRDCAGHYMRRLRNVALSIPAVVGRYTSVNCTLSLLRSTVRTSPLLQDGTYARQDEDNRFVDYLGAVESVVTSGADRDSGSFDGGEPDERFQRFEGAGAVGTWRLELPTDFRPFNYAKISDVVMHIRYTARQGGALLAGQATTELGDLLATANESGLALLHSLQQDFPTEWSAFALGQGDLKIRLRKDYFPYMVQDLSLTIDALELYAPVGTQLMRRSLNVPNGMAASLNGSDGFADVAISEDANLLKRDAKQVHLIIRFSI